MKEEKKMRKKIIGLMIAGVLVLAFGFVSTPATAELSLGLVGGYYSPNFGKINDDLEEDNDYYGTDLKFKAGMMYGLALRYDVNPHFELRLEYQTFQSKTSDTGSHFSSNYWYSDWWCDYYLLLDEEIEQKVTLTTTPIILSAIYRAVPFYIGAGVGSFPTKAKVSGTWEADLYYEYYDWWWGWWFGPYYLESYWADLTDSDSDSPMGFVVLAGFELVGGKKTFLNLEARYVSAEAELDKFDTKVDLGGFQVGVTGGFKF